MHRTIFPAILYIIMCAAAMPAAAQRAGFSKMSAYVRGIALQEKKRAHAAPTPNDSRRLCAFVRLDGNADSTLAAHGCRSLAHFGDIHIADIPLSQLGRLSLSTNVTRIEAGRSCSLTMDVAAKAVGALPAYEGRALPQAFTGKGVVMGVMDVGFDLTHPTFYDTSMADYRIERLWDQLSADTIGSTLYVGADYTTRKALLGYAHCRDGLQQTHGTHTLGIAAGSGYDSPYRGIAHGSAICLVANAVTDDLEFIADEDLYKYTYATDALGFKYIFDYAEATRRPCVISFSEGSLQDFHGDDMLYYAILDSLTGPGRIIVASAGNMGHLYRYLHKPAGLASAGAMTGTWENCIGFTVKTDGDGLVRMVCRNGASAGAQGDTLAISTRAVAACEDSTAVDTIVIAGRTCELTAVAYPSCYDAGETCCDVYIKGISTNINGLPFSVELLGEDNDTELHLISGYLLNSEDNPTLANAELTHSINSPSSAPSVICVGATAHRMSVTNHRGDEINFVDGAPGDRSMFSSVGPTFDGRVKPDVMAPGINVISSYSSYFRDANPDAFDATSDVAYFAYNGRRYIWNSNSGTSMSAPIVGGAIALWLEAKPDLTPQEALGVISRTSRRIDDSLPVPNNLWGYGEIDIYRGLLDLLGISGIEDIGSHLPPSVSAAPSGPGRLRLRFDNLPTAPVTLRLYSTDGTLTATRTVVPTSHDTTLDVPTHPDRIYAVCLTSADKRACGSTLVRW